MKNRKLYPRKCDECGKGMSNGYCIDNGDWHYCNKDCLNKNYPEEVWNLIYSDDGDSYWTEWEDIEVEENGIGYTIIGEEVCLDEKKTQ